MEEVNVYITAVTRSSTELVTSNVYFGLKSLRPSLPRRAHPTRH